MQESPLEENTFHNNYEFSMGAKKFNIYMIKIIKKGKICGFLVLQRKNHLLKVLFSYHENSQQLIANIILMHVFRLKVKEILCYDKDINKVIISKQLHLYKRNKIKESIISKVFEETNYENYQLNLGDGDCCFA